jgi:exopolysaccharide biosynthesis WecB/TagA/CpsF family protein
MASVIDLGKKNVLGVLVDAVDYEAASDRIISAAQDQRSYGVSALAVHGVMTGVKDPEQKYRLNNLDLVTPDGQPVKWALNWLYKTNLKDRVYGPNLTLRVCAAAAAAGLPVFFYGSRPEVLVPLARNLEDRFPGLKVAGTEPSKFRRVSSEEKGEIVARITSSGARITFVGLGCPRQEVFAFEFKDDLSMPVVAVGAAFDYHAGLVREPSPTIQRLGLQWLYRLLQDPRRLWKRYLLLGGSYLLRLVPQLTGTKIPDPQDTSIPSHQLLFG